MYKIITLIVVLLTISLQSTQAQSEEIPQGHIKLKMKCHTDGICKVKFLVQHDSVTKKIAEKRGVKESYVSSTILKVDEKVVYEFKGSPFIAKNPLFKLGYENRGGEKLTLIVKNNLGDRYIYSKAIEQEAGKVSPKVYSAKENVSLTSEEMIVLRDMRSLFEGKTLTLSDTMSINAPTVCSNGSTVPVKVDVHNLDVKRIIFFASEENKIKEIGEWIVHDQSQIAYSLKIKLGDYKDPIENLYRGSAVAAVVETESGEYYISVKKIEVALGGSEG